MPSFKMAEASAPRGGGGSRNNKISVQTAVAEQGATSATYTIPREYTIPSDGCDHKVTIGLIVLQNCAFQYYAVPKLDANAYLKVKTTNTSPYSLLKGPMNIFFDNHFVSTSQLEPVFPTEEFETFLGRDPSVKLEYKPAQRFRQSKGFMSNTNSTKVTRTTVIKNLKHVPISITIKEQVPVSTNENIKVVMVRPDLKGQKEISNVPLITDEDQEKAFAISVTIDDASILEWTIGAVHPQQQVQVPFTYTVDWPSANDLNTPDF